MSSYSGETRPNLSKHKLTKLSTTWSREDTLSLGQYFFWRKVLLLRQSIFRQSWSRSDRLGVGGGSWCTIDSKKPFECMSIGTNSASLLKKKQDVFTHGFREFGGYWFSATEFLLSTTFIHILSLIVLSYCNIYSAIGPDDSFLFVVTLSCLRQ